VAHNDSRLTPEYRGPGNAALRPDRDRRFGRIWRVQHQQARRYEAPRLHQAGAEELVKALEHPNGWFRMTAHRLLVDQGDTKAAPALAALLRSDGPTMPAFMRSGSWNTWANCRRLC
jgi:uncharacterized protein